MKKRISLILAIVMIAAVFATAIPFVAFAEESPDDIVAEVWVEGASSAAIQIKRSEFASKFATQDTNNASIAEGVIGNNVTIKILMDIDVGDGQCRFLASEGKTLVIDGDPDGDGTNAKITGSNGGSPAIRAHGAGADKSKVIFKNLDYDKTGNNLFQHYAVAVELVNCNWNSITQDGFCPSNSGTVTLKSGTTVSAAGNAIYGNWGVDGGNENNTFIIESGATLKALGDNAVISVPAGTNGSVMNIEVNGGTVEGNITAKFGLVKLQSGSLTGELVDCANGVVNVFKGFVVNGVANTDGLDPDTEVTTPEPEVTTPDPSVPTAPTGNPDDIVVEIYETGTTTVLASVKRSEFVTKFAVNSQDILIQDPTLSGKNLTIEFKHDVTIPDSDNQCGMSAAVDQVITIKGNGHLVYGGKGGNPVMRFYGAGTFDITNLDFYHQGGSCAQFYNNVKMILNDCEWTTPDHYGFFLTGACSVELNEGTVISGGTYGIWNQSNADNTITINTGATVKSSKAAIAFNANADNFTLNLKGGSIICEGEGGAAINVPASNALNFFTVDSGSIKGDILLAVGNNLVLTLNAGSIEGAFVYEETGAIVLIKDGFVINGVAYVAPADTTTDGGETTTEDPNTTTTDGGEDETTPSTTTTDGGEDVTTPSVTTPDATTPPPAADEGCAGCGGIAIAAQLVALICAAAVVIIKKK